MPINAHSSNLTLFPHLTVLENCALADPGREHAKKTDLRAMHFLERVKIPEQAGQ